MRWSEKGGMKEEVNEGRRRQKEARGGKKGGYVEASVDIAVEASFEVSVV